MFEQENSHSVDIKYKLLMAEARGTFYDLPIANWNLFGSAKFPTSVQVLREMVFNLLCICWEIIALEVVEDFDAEPVKNKTGSCTPGGTRSSSNYYFSDQIFSPLKWSWMILMTQSENVSKLR